MRKAMKSLRLTYSRKLFVVLGISLAMSFIAYVLYSPDLLGSPNNEPIVVFKRNIVMNISMVWAPIAAFLAVTVFWKLFRGDHLLVDESGITDAISWDWKGHIAWDDIREVKLLNSPSFFSTMVVHLKGPGTAILKKYGITKNPKLIFLLNVGHKERQYLVSNFEKFKRA